MPARRLPKSGPRNAGVDRSLDTDDGDDIGLPLGTGDHCRRVKDVSLSRFVTVTSFEIDRLCLRQQAELFKRSQPFGVILIGCP